VRGRPWRIVAVQATLSIAAILIVYLTLLRADGGQPLYEVEGPGAIVGKQELPRGEPGRQAGRREVPTRSRTAPAELDAAPSLVAIEPEPSFQEPADDGGTPTSDQYSGTVGLIQARLAEAVD